MDISGFIKKLDALLTDGSFGAAKEYLYASLSDALSENDFFSAVSVYNEIMGFERQYGEKEAAKAAADSALELLERTGIFSSRPAAMIYLNAATVYASAGDTGRAKALYETAEKLFLRYYGPDDKEKAGLYNNMASVYLTPGEYGKARYYYERALSILARTPDVCDTAVTYFNLASLERLCGSEGAALGWAKKAESVMEIPEKDRDGYYRYTCGKLAAAAKELGLEDMAMLFSERGKKQ